MITKIQALILLILSGITYAYGQDECYFEPNITTSYILDSLNIPYLPITERNKKSLIVHGCTEISINAFKSFFNKGEFVYYPDKTTPRIPLVDLMGGSNYLAESDEFIMNFLFYFDMQFIGFADVPIDDPKYALVRIIETAQVNDAYTTILLLRTHDGQWDYIDEDVERVGEDYIVTYK
jgi:hypothetical protein